MSDTAKAYRAEAERDIARTRAELEQSIAASEAKAIDAAYSFHYAIGNRDIRRAAVARSEFLKHRAVHDADRALLASLDAVRARALADADERAQKYDADAPARRAREAIERKKHNDDAWFAVFKLEADTRPTRIIVAGGGQYVDRVRAAVADPRTDQDLLARCLPLVAKWDELGPLPRKREQDAYGRAV